jgi:hypothetical protein
MRDYSGMVLAEIVALLIMALAFSSRGRAVWYAVLGQAALQPTLAQGGSGGSTLGVLVPGTPAEAAPIAPPAETLPPVIDVPFTPVSFSSSGNSSARFTSIGVLVVGFAAIATAKGAWGLAEAWFLAVMIVALLLSNYRQVLSAVVTTAPAQGG